MSDLLEVKQTVKEPILEKEMRIFIKFLKLDFKVWFLIKGKKRYRDPEFYVERTNLKDLSEEDLLILQTHCPSIIECIMTSNYRKVLV